MHCRLGKAIWVVVLTVFVLHGQVHAQTLNDQNQALLAGNCAGLSGGPFGANLNAICVAGGVATGAGGGGAASVQASAASILNRTILQRLNEDRNEDDSSGQKHASILGVNPFGMFSPGMFGGFGMAAPGQPVGGTSGGTFGMSSDRWKGLGVFASGLVESLNRDDTTFQEGYKSSILGFTAGADYRFSRQVTAGAAFTYSNTNGDFRQGGDFSNNGYEWTVFGQYLPTDRTFIQVTGGYGRNSYLVNRRNSLTLTNIAVNGFSSSNSNADVFKVGVLTGYDHPIGMFTVGPRVGLNYSHTHIHDYDEQGATGLELKFDDQYVNSLQSLLGVQGQAAISTSFGVLVPQANVDYIHEFANSQRFLNVQYAQDFSPVPTKFRFQNDVPVRNYFNLGAGLLMVMPNGWQPFVNFRAMVGNEQFNNYAGTFGVRIEM